MRRSIGVVAVAAALLAGGLAACGGDDDGDDSSPQNNAAQPSGQPVDLGFINVENSQAGSFADHRQGAEAAVAYINGELGGVNGRPLALEPCITNGSGESSIACANQFVQDKKVAVLHGIDYGADGSVPILEQAGIPYVGGLPVQPAELTSSDSFSFVGASPGAVSAIARYAGEDLEAKKVAILHVDIPAASLAADSFVKPILTKLGATDITTVAESATAADYTPALSKANQSDPDAIILLFGGQACAKIMQATTALNIDPSKMLYVQTCVTRDLLEAGGAGAQGVRSNTPFLAPESDHDDVKTYRNAMKKYAPDADIGPGSQGGFNSVMNTYALLRTRPADAITSAALLEALRSTNAEPNFMAHPYTCDGKQVPSLPAPCNANERIVEYRDGKFEGVKGDWVEGVSLLTP